MIKTRKLFDLLLLNLVKAVSLPDKIITWLSLTVFKQSVLFSSLFLLVSIAYSGALVKSVQEKQAARARFEKTFSLWQNNGITMPLSGDYLASLQEWNAGLGKRFTGRLTQELGRDHILFREVPYRLNQNLLIDYKELEALIGIFSFSQNGPQTGKQNGSLLLTKFSLKRLGEDSQVSYRFISRNPL